MAGPVHFWRKDVLYNIMTTCIILHRIVIEDERDLNVPTKVAREAPPPEGEMAVDDNTRFQEFLARYRQINDKEAHFAL